MLAKHHAAPVFTECETVRRSVEGSGVVSLGWAVDFLAVFDLTADGGICLRAYAIISHLPRNKN